MTVSGQGGCDERDRRKGGEQREREGARGEDFMEGRKPTQDDKPLLAAVCRTFTILRTQSAGKIIGVSKTELVLRKCNSTGPTCSA